MAETGEMETEIKEEDERPVKDVLCCRACLSTDGKLFDMFEYKLDEEFFRVSGIAVQEEKLPHYLCVWCAAVMKRSTTFRAKCLRANGCLQECLLVGHLTIDNIGNIDRQAHKLFALSVTKIKQIDIEGVDCSNKSVAHPTSSKNDANLKSEENNKNKRDQNNLYIQIDSLNRNNIKIDVVKESDVTNIKYEVDDVLKDEYHDENTDEPIPQLKCEVIMEPADKVKKEVRCRPTRKRTNVKKFDSTAVKKKKVKVKKEVNPKKEGSTKREGNAKKEGKTKREGKKRALRKDRRKSEDGFMPTVNLDKFKEACDVDIVILSKEEQLEEIAVRKASNDFINAPYSCELCGKYYRAEDAYNNHCEKHSEKKGPVECSICKIRFKSSNRCWQHYDTHRFKYVCKQCAFVSRTRSQAKLHYQYHVGRRYLCSFCPKVFTKLSTYLSHVRLVHKTLNEVCGMCGETFVNVQQHKAIIHGVALKKEQMECKTCEVTFINTHALNKHKMAAGEEHTKMFPCVQCGDNFDSVDAMKIHDDKEHPKCEDCKVTFLNAAAFDTHVDRKHRGVGHHIERRQKEANKRAKELGRPPPYSSPRRKLICDHCGKMFTSSALLLYHLRRLRGEKMRYACPHCPQSYDWKDAFEGHVRSHTGEKPFKCEHCDMAFAVKCNLQRHVLNVHLGICKKSACEICGRVFSTPSSVKLHVRTVHNGEPWPRRVRKNKTKVFQESPSSSYSSPLPVRGRLP